MRQADSHNLIDDHINAPLISSLVDASATDANAPAYKARLDTRYVYRIYFCNGRLDAGCAAVRLLWGSPRNVFLKFRFITSLSFLDTRRMSCLNRPIATGLARTYKRGKRTLCSEHGEGERGMGRGGGGKGRGRGAPNCEPKVHPTITETDIMLVSQQRIRFVTCRAFLAICSRDCWNFFFLIELQFYLSVMRFLFCTYRIVYDKFIYFSQIIYITSTN